jgi:hypothetical protein
MLFDQKARCQNLVTVKCKNPWRMHDMKIEYFKQDIKFLIFELVLWCNDTQHNDNVQHYGILAYRHWSEEHSS